MNETETVEDVFPDGLEQFGREIDESTNRVISTGNATFEDFDAKINGAVERKVFGNVGDDPFAQSLVKMGDEGADIIYAISHNPELEKKLSALPSNLRAAYVAKNKEAILDNLPLERMSMEGFMREHNRRSKKRDTW